MKNPERTPYMSSAAPVTREDHDKALAGIKQLEETERLVTIVLLVLGIGGLIFTAVNVTLFAIDHDTHPAIAWMLDPLVSVSLLAALLIDGKLAAHGYKPGGWPFMLRWFAGLATWLMNCWGSLYPDGGFTGWPSDADPAGLLLHSAIPALVVLLAEAGAGYRKFSLRRKGEYRTVVNTWQQRQDEQRREQSAKAEREQQRLRDEQAAREQAAREQQRVREQREHEALLAEKAAERAAQLERERAAREQAAREAELQQQERIRLAEIAAAERREQQDRADQLAREQADREAAARRVRDDERRREQQRAAREHPPVNTHEQSKGIPAAPREQRPLHAVNTPVNTSVNTSEDDDKVPEAEALERVAAAVESGEVPIRGLARETGWSPGWVSARVKELRPDDPTATTA